jgi:hypothetical protein
MRELDLMSYRGKADGQIADILKLLRRRGIVVEPPVESRIRDAPDLATLDKWFDRAIDAKSLGDLFDEGYRIGAMDLIHKMGQAQGHAQGILRLLRRRGIVVSAAAELRIREAPDLATLEKWFDRAIEAKSVREVFREGRARAGASPTRGDSPRAGLRAKAPG